MEILEAYCEDLGRVVEIYEAQEEYFAQPERARQRFRFLCSDPDCRNSRKTLVVGVNYDKDAEESEKYKQPHFKSHSSHPHLDTCVWMVRDAKKGREEDADDKHGIRHAHPKATNVVDVFNPRESDVLLGVAAADIRISTEIDGAAEPHAGGHQSERIGLSTTSRLEKLVDCWSNLEIEERRSHRMAISDYTLTYHQLCLRIGILSENENGTRVVYGGARVKAWPEKEPTHYYVNFMDECDRFPEASGSKSLTISLPIKRLKQSRRGGLLMNRIEQALKPGHYLKVYAWGEIVPQSGGKQGYELNLTALDNVVLKVVQSKGIKTIPA